MQKAILFKTTSYCQVFVFLHNMKKAFILLVLLLSFFACSNKDVSIHEFIVSKDKIQIPTNEIDDGKFNVIFRNYDSNSINVSFYLTKQGVTNNSQSLDYCEGINAIRDGKNVVEWTIINPNFSVKPETEVINVNDHPNIINYNLPVGTYLLMLMDAKDCSKDNYQIINVKNNSYIESLK